MGGSSFDMLGQTKKYQMPDGQEIDVEETLGWCFACKKMRMVEDFSNKSLLSELEEVRQKMAQSEAQLNTSKLEYEKQMAKYEARVRFNFTLAKVFLTPLWKCFIKPPQNNETSSFQKLLDFLSQKERKILGGIKYYQTRKSPRKCLACGSVKIEEMSKDMFHPGCGGSFILIERYERNTRIRITVSPSRAIYDSEGDPIEGQNQEIVTDEIITDPDNQKRLLNEQRAVNQFRQFKGL